MVPEVQTNHGNLTKIGKWGVFLDNKNLADFRLVLHTLEAGWFKVDQWWPSIQILTDNVCVANQ